LLHLSRLILVIEAGTYARMKCCFTVVSIACVLVLGSSAGGQIIPCLQGFNGGIMYGIEGSKNAPFSGIVKSSFEQKLADGNTIHGVTRTHQARDASGRTMTRWRRVACVVKMARCMSA